MYQNSMQQQQNTHEDDSFHIPGSETTKETVHPLDYHPPEYHQPDHPHFVTKSPIGTSKRQLQVDEKRLVQHPRCSSTKNGEYQNCKWYSSDCCDAGAEQEKSLFMSSNKKEQHASEKTTESFHNWSVLSRAETPIEIKPPTDFCNDDFYNDTIATITLTTSTTTTTSLTTSTHQQQLEQPHLHSMTTLQAAVICADADAMDADVERAISSILCQQQQTVSTAFYEGYTSDNHDQIGKPILVAAKQMVDPKSWKLLTVICLLIVGGVIAVVLIIVTNNNNNNNQSQSTDSMSPKERPVEGEHNQSLTQLPFYTEPPVNSTIGEVFRSHIDSSILSVAYKFETGQIYLGILEQQDTQFTMITFDIEKVTLVVNHSVLEHYLDPIWNGHTVSTLNLCQFHAFLL